MTELDEIIDTFLLELANAKPEQIREIVGRYFSGMWRKGALES